uniref:Uncharacterized protein n=1 Tax=Cacopsylla melanoneura TaxID=428564 RepID=A0A8D8M8V4_9HEMI
MLCKIKQHTIILGTLSNFTRTIYCNIGNLLFTCPKHRSMMTLSFFRRLLKAISSFSIGFLYGVIKLGSMPYPESANRTKLSICLSLAQVSESFQILLLWTDPGQLASTLVNFSSPLTVH